MKKKGTQHSERLLLPMIITILIIAVFQVYWLKENYSREEKTLTIKSEVAFRETIQHLQVVKLKLDGIPGDSLKKGNVKIFVGDGNDEEMAVHFNPRQEIVSTINVIRDKLMDSLKKNPGVKPRMIISMNNTSLVHG